MAWADGKRVRVEPHPFWPDGATGTVRPFPAVAAELCGGADGWRNDMPRRAGANKFTGKFP